MARPGHPVDANPDRQRQPDPESKTFVIVPGGQVLFIERAMKEWQNFIKGSAMAACILALLSVAIRPLEFNLQLDTSSRAYPWGLFPQQLLGRGLSVCFSNSWSDLSTTNGDTTSICLEPSDF